MCVVCRASLFVVNCLLIVCCLLLFVIGCLPFLIVSVFVCRVLFVVCGLSIAVDRWLLCVVFCALCVARCCR